MKRTIFSRYVGVLIIGLITALSLLVAFGNADSHVYAARTACFTLQAGDNSSRLSSEICSDNPDQEDQSLIIKNEPEKGIEYVGSGKSATLRVVIYNETKNNPAAIVEGIDVHHGWDGVKASIRTIASNRNTYSDRERPKIVNETTATSQPASNQSATANASGGPDCFSLTVNKVKTNVICTDDKNAGNQVGHVSFRENNGDILFRFTDDNKNYIELKSIKGNYYGEMAPMSIATSWSNLKTNLVSKIGSFLDTATVNSENADLTGTTDDVPDISGSTVDAATQQKINDCEANGQTYDQDQDACVDTEEDKLDCWSTAPPAVGWFLCPVTGALESLVGFLYERIDDYLKIEPKLFEANNGTQQAWSYFRNLANVIFIILFLVVIFSQLTGVGIDNYGIKKILPKLIIAAILINLSYVICQLAIDAANIAGGGIEALLNKAGDSIQLAINADKDAGDVFTNAASPGNTGANAAILVVAIAASAGILFVLFKFARDWATGVLGGFLMLVVGAIVSIAIAGLFLFILLAVRNALAVILVIVSPLAFICYILPNLKQLFFDKWFGLFKGLLFAYPICSFLVYGGSFVGKLIIRANIGSENMGTVAVSALLISVVPFFLIPSAIKQSLNAISQITGILDKMKGKAQGTVSPWVKQKMQDHTRVGDWAYRRQMNKKNRLETRRGQYIADSDEKEIGKLENVKKPSRKQLLEMRMRTNRLTSYNEQIRKAIESYAANNADPSAIIESLGGEEDVMGITDENAIVGLIRGTNYKPEFTYRILDKIVSDKEARTKLATDKNYRGAIRNALLANSDDPISIAFAKSLNSEEFLGNLKNERIGDAEIGDKDEGVLKVIERKSDIFQDEAEKGVSPEVYGKANKDFFQHIAADPAVDLMSDQAWRAALSSQKGNITANEQMATLFDQLDTGRQEQILSGMNMSQLGSLQSSFYDTLARKSKDAPPDGRPSSAQVLADVMLEKYASEDRKYTGQLSDKQINFIHDNNSSSANIEEERAKIEAQRQADIEKAKSKMR